jgi:hypothetical protein
MIMKNTNIVLKKQIYDTKHWYIVTVERNNKSIQGGKENEKNQKHRCG